jgi:hypothetical protein
MLSWWWVASDVEMLLSVDQDKTYAQGRPSDFPSTSSFTSQCESVSGEMWTVQQKAEFVLEELIAYFPWFVTDRTEIDASNNSIVACVFAAVITFLRNISLATIGGTHIDTDWWEGFMKHAGEMGPCAMICIPNFIKIGSDIRNIIRGGSTDA